MDGGKCLYLDDEYGYRKLLWNQEKGEKDEGIKAHMLRRKGLHLDWCAVDMFILSLRDHQLCPQTLKEK